MPRRGWLYVLKSVSDFVLTQYFPPSRPPLSFPESTSDNTLAEGNPRAVAASATVQRGAFFTRSATSARGTDCASCDSFCFALSRSTRRAPGHALPMIVVDSECWVGAYAASTTSCPRVALRGRQYTTVPSQGHARMVHSCPQSRQPSVLVQFCPAHSGHGGRLVRTGRGAKHPWLHHSNEKPLRSLPSSKGPPHSSHVWLLGSIRPINRSRRLLRLLIVELLSRIDLVSHTI